MKMFEKNVKAIAILSSHCIVSLANLLITIPENAKDVNFQSYVIYVSNLRKLTMFIFNNI